jgi:hypothetical protein
VPDVCETKWTSTYWKATFSCLEEVPAVWPRGAAHIKAVPGRKTDVRDAEWIAQLLEHGLVRPSLRAGNFPFDAGVDRGTTYVGVSFENGLAGARTPRAPGRRPGGPS